MARNPKNSIKLTKFIAGISAKSFGKSDNYDCTPKIFIDLCLL